MSPPVPLSPVIFLFSLPVNGVQCGPMALPVNFDQDCNSRSFCSLAGQICFGSRRDPVPPYFIPKMPKRTALKKIKKKKDRKREKNTVFNNNIQNVVIRLLQQYTRS